EVHRGGFRIRRTVVGARATGEARAVAALVGRTRQLPARLALAVDVAAARDHGQGHRRARRLLAHGADRVLRAGALAVAQAGGAAGGGRLVLAHLVRVRLSARHQLARADRAELVAGRACAVALRVAADAVGAEPAHALGAVAAHRAAQLLAAAVAHAV